MAAAITVAGAIASRRVIASGSLYAGTSAVIVPAIAIKPQSHNHTTGNELSHGCLKLASYAKLLPLFMGQHRTLQC